MAEQKEFKAGQVPIKGQEERAGDPALKGSGLPPAVGPDLVPAGARVRTVGQPLIGEGHLVDGELAVVAGPIVLANGGGEHDPKNPARAPVREPVLSRDPARRAAQEKLAGLLRKGPGHPDYDADEVHRLHYAAAGEPYPGDATPQPAR